jgi:hypothetical protein
MVAGVAAVAWSSDTVACTVAWPLESIAVAARVRQAPPLR